MSSETDEPPHRGRDLASPFARDLMACKNGDVRPSRETIGRASSVRPPPGSQSARSRAEACDGASVRVAFRLAERRRHSGSDYFAARYPDCMCPVNASMAASRLALHAQTAQAEFKRPFPTVISTDFGFRIDHATPGQVIRGTLLVRIQGEWQEIQASTDVTPLAKPL
jgi:hypothetical protein